MIIMISSLGKNRELGKKNGLIWHIPEDLKFFKNTTMGHKILMGSKTYESLPGKLSGREMIVLSYEPIDGVKCVNNIDCIVDKYKDSDEDIYICGGASVYNCFIDYAKKMYLTYIDSEDGEADTFFPKFDENDWNKKVLKNDKFNEIRYSICELERKK